ncbi:uncharacterized protein LOC111872098 [Cryptotermes secundus]|uniref:uncharacterized protein LOC111872098 n=1 Tax=Cryptotermes secundus TaxID=105785 RepID=UPI000CD7D3BC|nr:uncharacterized protein LOC111872098 [Cryptotermes secundus]XP_023721420.1 uncharacterized protein LOC111872098 [Cryptotermes secundus]
MALPGKLMSLAHEFADKNKIEQMFNRTAKLVGKNWVLAFCRRQNLMLHTPEKCRLGRAIEFNKIQCEGFHNNLVSVCAEKKFPAHPKFNVDESGISTVPNHDRKLPRLDSRGNCSPWPTCLAAGIRHRFQVWDTAITQTNVAGIFRSANKRVANLKIAVRAIETTVRPSQMKTASSEVTFCPHVQENQATAEDTFQ